MAEKLSVGNLYEVKWWSLLGSQLGLTSCHFICTVEAGLGGTAEGFADYLSLNTAGKFKDCLNNNAFFRGLTVWRIWPLPKPVPIVRTTGAGAGTGAGDPLPKQISGICKKKTAQAGRSQRGRMYIPFPSEGDNNPTEGRPSGGYIAKLALFDATIESIITVGTPPDTSQVAPCIVHRGVPGTFTFMTEFDEAPYWGTQRRRGDYGPQNIAPF